MASGGFTMITTAPCPLRVGHGIRGRGVFAQEPIAAGEDIECCPVVLVPEDQLGSGVLARYLFWWDAGDDGCYALPAGHGLLFNHDVDPNVGFRTDKDLLSLRFFSLRPIAAGQELLINYDYDADYLARIGHPTWYVPGGTP